MDAEHIDRLGFLQELIGCVTDLYYWRLDSDYTILETNCPDVGLISVIQTATQNTEEIDTLSYRTDAPIVVTNDLGLMWVADFEKIEPGEYHRRGTT